MRNCWWVLQAAECDLCVAAVEGPAQALWDDLHVATLPCTESDVRTARSSCAVSAAAAGAHRRRSSSSCRRSRPRSSWLGRCWSMRAGCHTGTTTSLMTTMCWSTGKPSTPHGTGACIPSLFETAVRPGSLWRRLHVRAVKRHT